MPPKKTDGAAAPKSKSTHGSYQDMITDAIVALKDRNGSSRPSLKKYVKANNNLNVTDGMFDSLFNKALRTGVEKGVFEQPKGASGGTKLAKKTAKPAAPKTAKKPAVKKETKEKKATATKAKKPAATKAAKDKKPAAPKAAKKAAAPKKAPAVVDKPKTLTKTKSGRVAKTTAAPAKKAAPKKAAPKKAAAKA